jgi:hypothetical protein
MAQITNARTIREVEQILYAGSPHMEARSWTVAGVECRRDRHRYAGESYGFASEVVHLRFSEPGRPRWEVLIVGEWWTTRAPDASIRSVKWLKLLRGKASDLRDWIHRNRESHTA